jgi:hypothetical protein
MKRIIFALTVLFFGFVSCDRTDNYIIPVDYEKYYKDVTSLTEKKAKNSAKKS